VVFGLLCCDSRRDRRRIPEGLVVTQLCEYVPLVPLVQVEVAAKVCSHHSKHRARRWLHGLLCSAPADDDCALWHYGVGVLAITSARAASRLDFHFLARFNFAISAVVLLPVLYVPSGIRPGISPLQTAQRVGRREREEDLTKRCSEPRTVLMSSFHCMRTSLLTRAVADLVSR
jgi:hypothetical protein